MKRFKIEFDGKEYNVVELNGKCVDLDTIILGETALNDAIEKYYDNSDEYDDMVSRGIEIDDNIFGFGELDLILNGTETELENYAKSLL